MDAEEAHAVLPIADGVDGQPSGFAEVERERGQGRRGVFADGLVVVGADDGEVFRN